MLRLPVHNDSIGKVPAMSISVTGMKKKFQNVDDVQNFGMGKEVAEFETKQFVNLYKGRVNVMLKDSTQRSYANSKEGAKLLFSHIDSEESDKTYWGDFHPETTPTGEKKQKKKQFEVVTLEFFAVQDLTESDFNKLATNGTIDAKQVYFSQLRCSPAFGLPITLGDGTVCPGLWELTAALKKKATYANDVQPIKIIWYRNKVTSVDNRRLKAHREAGVQVRYQKTEWDDLSSGEKAHFDPQAPAANINVT
jgi:hypothetical protein